MSFFWSMLVVEKIGKRRWRLLKNFQYVSTGRFSNNYIVPKGFVTDFASVPHGLQWIWPKSGWYNEAAVVHDYLCSLKMYKLADYIFWEALGVRDNNKVTRYLFYWVVRLYHKFNKSKGR
jgi:hypothetical protein